MSKQSAGILLYRTRDKQPEVFLIHPGGPFFRNKDDGAWSIPKGEFIDGEEALAAAKREFEEETGQVIEGEFIVLDPITQKGGKKVFCWAVEGDIDPEVVMSNTFELEWPPRSGKKQTFQEVDKAGWFDIETAKVKMNDAQTRLLDNLLIKLKSS